MGRRGRGGGTVEFAWARRWLKGIKAGTEKGLNSLGIVLAGAGSDTTAPSADAEKVAHVPEKDV